MFIKKFTQYILIRFFSLSQLFPYSSDFPPGHTFMFPLTLYSPLQPSLLKLKQNKNKIDNKHKTNCFVCVFLICNFLYW